MRTWDRVNVTRKKASDGLAGGPRERDSAEGLLLTPEPVAIDQMGSQLGQARRHEE
jgi:hypothetical protein